MSKRSAPSSSNDDLCEVKKARIESPMIASSEKANLPAQEALTGATNNQTDIPNKDLTANVNATVAPETTEATEVKQTKKKSTRKAGEGFEPWTPSPAHVDIPEVLPHWGIVPRPNGYERPSQQQPPAHSSDGAIRPALWEDRKCAVRLKRGSRYINGYDQAYHMWLPLMDLRPISAKKQQPRRIAVGYYYSHGMPKDWNDTAALNDLNKALQEAIKSKSNKDAPFSQVEQNILAKIFAEDPKISMLDAAEKFNERAHPVTGTEEGRYPTGRFTESIQHEFRIHRSCYIKGEAPTDKTEKDIPLEVAYKEWKAAQSATKSNGKKSIKKSSPGKMSDTAGVTKKRRIDELTTSDDASPEKTAEAAGKAKKRKSKTTRTDEELAAHADATYAEIVAKEAAEEAAKVAAESQASEQVETPATVAEQTPRSEEDENLLTLAGAYAPEDTRSSSPVSAKTREIVESLSYGTRERKITAEYAVETQQTVVTEDVVPGLADEPSEALELTSEVAQETIVAPTEAATERTDVTNVYVQKAARKIEVDESYSDDSEDLYLVAE